MFTLEKEEIILEPGLKDQNKKVITQQTDL